MEGITQAEGAARRTRRGGRRSARQRMVDEAIVVIGQRGYYGFSVQEVAERVGVTVAGVLHHFKTKDGLLLAVLEERDRRDTEASMLAFPVPSAGTGDGTLGEGPTSRSGTWSLESELAVLRAVVQRNVKQPELVRLYTVLRSEALYPEHPAYAYFRERDRWALEELARGLEHLVGEPMSVARHILAVMGGLEEQWLRASGEMDLVEESCRAFAALLSQR